MSKLTISVTFDHLAGQERVDDAAILALQQIAKLDHLADMAYCEVRMPDGRLAVITGTQADEHG